jgi:osmotically-inducible protein OsmY
MAMMPGDMVLNDAVSAALTQAMGSDAKDIKVTNKDNVVTLTGWVNHPDQLSKALATAGRVPGVKKAYSQIHTWSSEN